MEENQLVGGIIIKNKNKNLYLECIKQPRIKGFALIFELLRQIQLTHDDGSLAELTLALVGHKCSS